MKQHITKQQWDEISDEQKDEIWSSLDETYLPNIGQMIEFLGEDYKFTFDSDERFKWSVYTKARTCDKCYKSSIRTDGYEEELCDALWEAVKFKLNNYEKTI